MVDAWPSELPHATIEFMPVGGAKSGGSFGGQPPATGKTLNGPRWRATLTDLHLRTREEILAARALEGRLSSGQPVLVSPCVGGLTPQVRGGAPITTTFGGAAAAGATSVIINLSGDHHPLRGGEDFSVTHGDAYYGRRLYRIVEVTGGTTDAPHVTIVPPLHVAVANGQACDFLNPSCPMYLADGFDLAVDLGRFADVEATFEEWFTLSPPLTLLGPLSLTNDTLIEASVVGTLVGAITGDTDGSTLTLTDNAGGRFSIANDSGTWKVYAGATATSYASATSHTITVRETLADRLNSPRDTVLTIEILPVHFDIGDLDLIVWYAARKETVYSDGDPVTVLHDFSGRGKDATGGAGAAGGTQPPMVTVSDIGGLPAIQFNAVGGLGGYSPRFLIPDTVYSGISIAGGITLFAVVKRSADPPISVPTMGPILFGLGDTSFVGHWPATNGHIAEGFGSTTRRDIGDPTPSLASPRIYGVLSATNDWRAYFDGDLFYSTSVNTLQVANSPASPYIPAFRIGDGQYGVSFYGFDGQIAEIIIVNGALDDTTRQKVEGVLAHLYSIDLDPAHPYYAAPPT